MAGKQDRPVVVLFLVAILCTLGWMWLCLSGTNDPHEALVLFMLGAVFGLPVPLFLAIPLICRPRRHPRHRR